MSRAHNKRITLEQQIHPLVTKDIPTFFPAIVLSDISPFRTFVTFRHYDGRAERYFSMVAVNSAVTRRSVAGSAD